MTQLSEKSPLSKQDDSSTFSSRAGTVITCLGCAVGTGNIWRFPRMVALNSGKKGALCFLLPWSLFLFIWSVPMLIIEYATGRYTGQGVVVSLQRFMGDKAIWCGLWLTAVNFIIGAWYHVVMGWCILYTYQVMVNPLPKSYIDSSQLFHKYIEASYWPVLTQALGITITGLLMLKDIKLIERFNLVMVPTLLVMVAVMFVWSLTRHLALDGIKFFFTPDFATLASPSLWMDAASQNAFDSNAGWGMFIALSSAMKTGDPIVKYSLLIPIGNNIVSLICGMMMFSTAFSSLPGELNTTSTESILDILQTSGPASSGLTFIWLPVLLSSAGVAGRVFASFFFLSLVIAAISSLIGILENVIQVFVNYGVSRTFSVLIVMAASFVLGLGSSTNLTFLTNQDFTWGYALVISGLILQIMVIQYGTSKFREHVINRGNANDWNVPKIWEWFVKLLGPLQVVILLTWWISDTILSSLKGQQAWYTFGPETLLPAILQWTGLAAILILINVVLLCVKPSWFVVHSTNESSELTDEPTDAIGVGSSGYDSVKEEDKSASRLSDRSPGADASSTGADDQNAFPLSEAAR